MTELDDVLYRIESEIKGMVGPEGQAPPPQRPRAKVVDVKTLETDTSE